jgi:hypothetical protein
MLIDPPPTTAPVATPRRPPALSWRKKLLFSAVLLAAFLVAAEGAVRIFTRLTDRERLYRLDPVAGYTCKASLVHKPKRYGDHSFYYSTNERGFRVTAPADAVRTGRPIVLLGDSFTFGYCVNDEDSLGYILSAETGAPVASLSAAGYSPDIYLPLLREYLQARDNSEKDTRVVVLICDNDFTDLTQRYKNHRPKAYFERAADGYRECRPRVGWLDRLADASDLVYLLVTTLTPATRPTNVPYEETPRLMAHVVKQMQTLCAERGVEFKALLFEHLDKPQVTPAMRDEFVARCRQQGLEVPVITQQIKAGNDDVNVLLAADHWHWSRLGNERVAAIIRQYLR